MPSKPTDRTSPTTRSKAASPGAKTPLAGRTGTHRWALNDDGTITTNHGVGAIAGRFNTVDAMAKPLQALVAVCGGTMDGLRDYLVENSKGRVARIFVPMAECRLGPSDATAYRGSGTQTNKMAGHWSAARDYAMAQGADPMPTVPTDPLADRADPGAAMIFRKTGRPLGHDYVLSRTTAGCAIHAIQEYRFVMRMTENYRLWVGNWFDDEDPETYVEGCETAPEWLADDIDGFAAFRDELAAHIRDSTDRSLRGDEPQWINDEWLRNLYYDLFGPEPPPDDPYPVPADDWARRRWTPYMLYGVGRSEELLSDEARVWLATRHLTMSDINLGHQFRREPDGYQERLERLTRQGARRSHPRRTVA